MRLAGVTAGTPDPTGGEILRDDDGNPIGVFRETAQELVSRAHSSSIRRRSAAERTAQLQKAIEVLQDELDK